MQTLKPGNGTENSVSAYSLLQTQRTFQHKPNPLLPQLQHVFQLGETILQVAVVYCQSELQLHNTEGLSTCEVGLGFRIYLGTFSAASRVLLTSCRHQGESPELLCAQFAQLMQRCRTGTARLLPFLH